MRALPRGNDRSGEFVVEQRSQTTRSLATIYVASTGIKKIHMRALPIGNNRSGEDALKTTFPNNTIARDDLCREYRRQKDLYACITKR